MKILSDDHLGILQAQSERAHPGRREAHGSYYTGGWSVLIPETFEGRPEHRSLARVSIQGIGTVEDAAFLAACDPETILSMIHELLHRRSLHPDVAPKGDQD